MNNRVELYLGNHNVDTAKGANVYLSQTISDITQPNTQQGGYSLQILLPFTAKNNIIMKTLYDTQVSSNAKAEPFNELITPSAKFATEFDRNIFVSAKIIVDGYTAINGLANIDNITEQGYEIVIGRGGASWADKLNNTKLTDVQLGSYCFNNTTVFDFDKNGNDDVVVFPLIDYGNISEVIYLLGISPNPSTDFNNWLDITDLFPAVFVKPLLEQAFLQNNLVLKSKWWAEDKNYNKILPFTNEKLIYTDPLFAEDTVQLIGIINTSPFIPPGITPVEFDATPVNEANQWNNVTAFTTQSRPDVICDTNKKIPYEIILNFDYTLPASTFVIATKLNGTTIRTTIGSSGKLQDVFEVQAEQLDQISFEYGTSGVTITQAQISITRLAVDNQEGMVLNIQDNLPDMSVLDLLLNIIAMGNLYITTNKEGNVVTLTEYNDFYLGLNIIQATQKNTSLIKDPSPYVDWTNKVDTERGYEMIFANQELPRARLFTYQEGDDYLSEEYQDKNNKVYGYYLWQNNNQNGDEQDELAVPNFASSQGYYEDIGSWFNGWYFTRYWDKDYRTPDTDTQFVLQTGTTPRILQYEYFGAGVPLNIRYNYNQNSYTDFNSYHVAYFDLPFNGYITDTYEQNLGFADKSGTSLVKTGLFRRHYEAQYNNIKKARTLTLYVYLSALDYYGFKPQNPVKIKNTWYHVLEINSWTASDTSQSCQVKLIQIS